MLSRWFRRQPEGVVARMRLLRLVDSGVLDAMKCPECHKASVSVWFTRPTDVDSRTWFVCGQCSFRCRIQDCGRPSCFREGRVDKVLQAYDADLLSKMGSERARGG